MVEENDMALGDGDRTTDETGDGMLKGLSLADTASFRAARDRSGFDPYNSIDRIDRKRAWLRNCDPIPRIDPWSH